MMAAKKQISIGFSPCPNDTFIFDALVNGKLDTGDLIFNPILADVEQLNRMAFKGELDITKISIGAYPRASGNYMILNAGSALGKGVGPLLVSKGPLDASKMNEWTIAIPGKNTTANLILSIFFPEITNKTELVFSEIEAAVLDGKVDAGLLIHEGRFTYAKRGLYKIADMGEVWESKMDIPLPLGCIAASRKFSFEEQLQFNDLIVQSIKFAYQNPASGENYIRSNAQEMEPDIIQKHIDLYVNEFSLDLTDMGRNAIRYLLEKGSSSGILPSITEPIFNEIKEKV